LALMAAPIAEANTGAQKLERLAIAQSQQLFKYYYGKPQSASPMFCSQAQSKDGVFLLPTASFWGGDRDFRCKIKTRSVVVDLGGYVPTEDNRPGSVYELPNGEKLTFAKENLERICDAILDGFEPGTATLDGREITGVPVSTSTFPVKINRTANNDPLFFYEDSKNLGHPGRLTSCYSGVKAIVGLSPGRHVLRVDLTELFGGTSTVMTYHILATRH